MTTSRIFGLILLTTLTLSGCGRVSAVGPLPPAPSEAPKTSADPLPLDAQPYVPATPQMVAPTGVGAGSGCEALNGCDVHAQLVVGDVQKKKVGFLWRKLKVTGKVTNRGAAPMDGEVVVRFKKNGSVVQSEYVALAALAPGASKAFEHSSSVAADDVEVTSRAL